MQRFLSVLVIVPLILALAVPARASEPLSNQVELLEYSTVSNSGSNVFTVNSEATITLDIPQYSKLRYVDLVIDTGGTVPSDISIRYNNVYTSLTVEYIGSYMYRAYGTVSGIYDDLNIRFQANGSNSFQLLSCKVGILKADLFTADADIFFITGAPGFEGYWEQGSAIDVPGDLDLSNANMDTYLGRVEIYDWSLYDSITIWGSVTGAGINSIRATLGTESLPMEVNFINQTDGTVITRNPSYDVALEGQYLYSVTVDLSDLDRTVNHSALLVYFSGEYSSTIGMIFTFQYVTGSVEVADTSGATWWERFTTFMTDLFNPSDGSGAVDDLGNSSDSISQGAADIHDFEQTQQSVLDTNFSTIQNTISFTGFATALVFVQKYTNMIFDGISKYSIVLTLPMFLGLFFYLCSRIPGVTRWRSGVPKDSPKDGDST